MKKSLLAPLAFALPFLLSAQELPIVTLADYSGNVVNETVIVKSGLVTNETDTVSLMVTLNVDEDRVVNVRRYELETVEGSYNFFCWGLCYNERLAGTRPVWVGQDPVTLVSGVHTSGFGAYYKPESNAGTAGFRFVFYDTAVPEDSTWVDIMFDVSVGIHEGPAAVLSFDAFPNPVVDGNMTLRCALQPGVQGGLVVYNALGGKVASQAIARNGSTLVLSREQLQPGVYFATVEVDGRAVITRRVVVGSR